MLTRNLTRDLVHGLTRGVTEDWFGTPAPQIQLAGQSIAEDAAVNTVIGALSVTNGGAATWTYTIEVGGDPDGKFNISVANLRVGAALDYETATSHLVTVTATPNVGSAITRLFSITVTDVVDDVREAGILTWDTEADDPTPDFTYDATDMEEGDTFTISVYSDVGLTDLIASASSPVTAPEASGNSLTRATGARTTGTYYYQAIHEPPVGSGTLSNVEVVTLVISGGAASTFFWLGF